MSRHHEQAHRDFDRALLRAKLGDLLARLHHRPNELLAYHEVRPGLAVTGERYRGVRPVPVEQIVGSTDRGGDFDRAFRPRRACDTDRWRSVARAEGEGRTLPPVQLYQIGDVYFVRDGHHRVSVARVRDRAFVDAEVVEVLVHADLPPTQVASSSARAASPQLQWLRDLVVSMTNRPGGNPRPA